MESWKRIRQLKGVRKNTQLGKMNEDDQPGNQDKVVRKIQKFVRAT